MATLPTAHGIPPCCFDCRSIETSKSKYADHHTCTNRITSSFEKMDVERKVLFVVVASNAAKSSNRNLKMNFFATPRIFIKPILQRFSTSREFGEQEKVSSYLFRTEIGGLVNVSVRRKNVNYAVYIEVSSLELFSSSDRLVLSWGMYRANSSAANDGTRTVETSFTKTSFDRYGLELDFEAKQIPSYLSFLLKYQVDAVSSGIQIKSHRKTMFCVPVGFGSGRPFPMGLSFSNDRSLNFAIFSRNAQGVVLCMYDDSVSGTPALELDLDPYVNRTGDVWHASFEISSSFVSYGYRFKWKNRGKINAGDVLLDPYAKILANSIPGGRRPQLNYLGQLNKEPAFDWSGDTFPNLPLESLFTYRLNVRRFTEHKSSKLPPNIAGTFSGLTEKLQHFKDLGVNAVLLEPIFPFDDQKGPYFPCHFFSPMNLYGPSGSSLSANKSMKEMVKNLHANGIEVLLEVVFTHTAENGGLKGIDDSSYYYTNGVVKLESKNALNCNYPIVQQMILDSLRHWVAEFHIDGFCFINATSMLWGFHGEYLSRPPLVEAIAFDPLLSKTKIIADFWDPHNNVVPKKYQTHFPHWKRWAEINSRFCNDVRNFMHSKGALSDLATRLCGSGDVFSDGRGPAFSFNFISRNSGLPLVDLVSFSSNELASELSWNCGEEGPTNKAIVLETRLKQIHNFLFVLFVSLGVPILNMGDECGQSSGGSPAYSDRKSLDWNAMKASFTIQTTQFISFLSALKMRRSDLLQKRKFLKEEYIDWYGNDLSPPKWDDPTCKFLAVKFRAKECKVGKKQPSDSSTSTGDLFIAFNVADHSECFILPQAPKGMIWHRLVDTGFPFPRFFSTEGEPLLEQMVGVVVYEMKSHSCVLFEARAFCNPADVEAFTEEKKQFLLIKRHGKGVDFVCAVQEIVDSYEKLKKQDLLVDRFNSKQVPCTKNENLVESSAKNGSKDYKEAHEVTLDSRLNSSYFTEGTSATVQTNAMLDKNEPLDTVVVAEIPFPSSRRRSKDICYQRSVSHKEELTVGGCRSSSRVGARRLQRSAELGKDNSKGSVIGSLKRNKQNRESPDVSESDGVYSSAFILSGSIEDNGSEIATVDSEKCSHNEGSSTDSGCKLEQSETVAECLEGDVKLNKGLDVQIKAAVIKKKRKPNRKRLTTDRSKLAGKVDNGPVMEISIHNSSETTENAHHQQELVNSSSKEDGDEHLPLVKRARVRMGKSSSAKEKLNMPSNAEESNQKFIGCPSEPIKTSFNYDIDSSADSDPLLANGALNKVSSSQVCSQSPGNDLNLLSPKEDHLFSCPSDPIKTSFNCDTDSSANRDPFLANGALNKVSSSQVCTHSPGNGLNLLSPKKDHSFSCPSEPIKMSFNCDMDSSAERDPFLANGALSKVSSSQVCTQSPGNWFNFLSPKKNHSFSCLVDGEAVLPPTKRLHRAFEAMSANTAEEGQTCTDAFSSMKTLTNSSLSSVSRCPHVNPESKTSYGLGVQDMDLVNNDAQHLSGDTTESFMEIDLHNQIDRSKVQHNESGEVVFQDVKDHQGDCENSNISDNNCTVVSVVQSQSSKQYSLSSIDRSGTVMRPPQCSVDESLPPNDESDGKTVELSNIKAENMDNEFDASEQETVMSVGPASSGGDDDVTYSLKDNTSVMPFSAEDVGCETMSLEPQLIDKGEVNDKYQLVEEFLDKQELKDPSSISFPNGHSGDGCIIRTNSCLTDGNDFLGQESPPNTLIGPMSTSDSSNYIQTNGSCSPDVHLQHKPSSCTPDDEGKFESLLAERSKSLGNNPDPHAALSSLEAMLGTLTRTKESIGRATRVAIECAKFGVASKVLEILVRSLETEASLHRRVDFFFLVDSILKGDVGGFFPSAIQAKLPRLLSTAAPPGSSAHGNRRQCLKVLRLWLERRILPESIIRHHIRELDSLCGSSGAFCRRSSRTERSLDDPVREMEGMLVDEYGSNSSFQLLGFCMPHMLKDEDDGTDSDEENFEAVTPVHELRNPEEREDRPVVIVKHRHILEDVDGELEMEDVAPRCEADLASSSGGVGWSAAQISHNQFEPHDMFPFVPPLPQDIPPSSPPLPLSPPSLPLPLSVLPPFHIPVALIQCIIQINIMPDHMVQSVAQQSNAPIIYQPVDDVACYHPSECDLRGHMTDSTCSSFNSFSVQLVRNVPQSDGTSFDNKDYPLWPPHPPPLNQFTHVQGDRHFKPWRENSPPYSKRFHSMQNGDREIYYNNHERMKPGPYEPVDSWRFSPHSFSGPWYPDEGRSYAPASYARPPREPSRFPSRGWRYPFRSMSRRNSMHHVRPPFEGPIPATIKGPGYWRSR